MNGGQRPLPLPEFVVMMAGLFAMVAFSIDAMLPALPEIATELSPDFVNRAQLVISAFALGMGLGMVAAGPITDRVGRKPVIVAGIGLYSLGAALAAIADTMALLLVARAIQGLGVAGPRIAGQAMIRDIYSGRRMAQISSFVTTVFVIVPALAPFIGSLIMASFGWRGIFGAFIIMGVVMAGWFVIRQPETLPLARRRSLAPASMAASIAEIFTDRLIMVYVASMALCFGILIGLISSIQQLYAVTYGKAETFPVWFMLGGLASGLTTLCNSLLVMRLGMRRLALFAFGGQAIISLWLVGWIMAGPTDLPFALFVLWVMSVFGMTGLTFGNLTALALEPLGHVAGIGATVISAVTTICGIAIAAPLGLAFNGTPLPLLIGTTTCSALAYGLMKHAKVLDPQTHKTRPLPALTSGDGM